MKIHTIDLNFMGNSRSIASFLVESSEGPIIIETGPHSTFPALEKGIQNAGFEVKDIQHVFLTHIHFDHAGAAWAFAKNGAKVYVHPLGAGHLSEPSKLYESARRIYLDMMDKLWGQMEDIPKDQVIVAENEEVYTIGNVKLKSWHTPGHAVHHIAWQMDDVMFTGDVAGVQINGPVIAPCPPPDINLEDWQNSINLIKKLNPSSMFLAHFGEVKNNTQAHLQALEENIHEQAYWVKERWERGDDQNKMVNEFNAFIQDKFMKMGMPQDDIDKYQAANPSFMSIAGLSRYWTKKLGVK